MPDQEDSNSQSSGAQGMAVVTFPEGESSREATNQPRHPRNLQGLLRFATELTRNEDAAGPSAMFPMDEERRKFLEEAICSLTIDATKEMKIGIDILSNKEVISAINCDGPVPDDVLQAFDSLTDIVINLDMSIGIYKLDGYKIFPVCLSCENSEVRIQACQLLGEICQNNPFCQGKALEGGFVHIILNILKGEDNDRVLKAALYAMSCIIREYEPSAKTFIDEGGCDALIRCVQRPSEALRNKAAFVLCHVYPKHTEAKAKGVKIVEALSNGLKTVVEDNPGHLLNALRVVVVSSEEDNSSIVLQRCSDSLVKELKENVEKQMRFWLADVNTYMEEIDCCKDVLKRINRLLKTRTETADTTNVDR